MATAAAKPDGTTRLTFVGWLGTDPVVAAWRSRDAADGWAVWVWHGGRWSLLGRLPPGGSPKSDGRTIANVIDPESGLGDIGTITGAGIAGVAKLPAAPWAAAWRDVSELVPMGEGGGFLLAGAPAIAVVAADGRIEAEPVPAGYVALGPTSDLDTFLLATSADAGEAGGLSASTPFDVYLWRGGDTKPELLKSSVTNIRDSSTGLGLLRTSDGNWFEISAAGAVVDVLRGTEAGTVVGPDEHTTVSLRYPWSGCDDRGTSACEVVVTSPSGNQVTLLGPVDGMDLSEQGVGMVLRPRARLGLPWRLVFGDPSHPTVVPID